MEYPIIIRAILEPSIDLFAKNLSSKANTGDNEYAIFEILKDKKLPVYTNHYIKPYNPDIVVLDKNNRLIIDIEIDEPYSNSGDPTHYLGNNHDTKRNSFFYEKGIHIIRFSEKQVVNHANICYLIIDLFIKSLNDSKCESTLKHWCKKISEPQWTKEYSKLLGQNKSRKQYPFDIVFSKEDIHIKKIINPLDYFITPVLKELSTDDKIEIPTIINHIKNHSTGEVGFSYFGLHFSNSEYSGESTELTKEVRKVFKESIEYPFFEKYFLERIQFIDNENVCLPIIIVKEGHNHSSYVLELLK
ncbi:MAG: hypothetical protein A2Y71_02565 [Bacteroidetes bacterium RBG_13_42_15]|nr:MAG: hypothetical protein A2Y71_02565 [Bacteroidetes bacterium RBG_13_42_15]